MKIGLKRQVTLQTSERKAQVLLYLRPVQSERLRLRMFPSMYSNVNSSIETNDTHLFAVSQSQMQLLTVNRPLLEM